MIGFRFFKVQPTDYIFQHRRGKIFRQGPGLSFMYFGPTSSLVRIPLASEDVPFIFEGITADFQSATVQGVLTYQISDPEKISRLMNYTLTPDGKNYTSDDPEKLPQRLINRVEVLARSALNKMELRKALTGIDELVDQLSCGIREDLFLSSLMKRITENKIVLIVRATRLDELIARFNTREQA